MEKWDYNEEVNKRRGRIATIIYHLFLLLVFIFATLQAQQPEPEEEGILINFGTVKAASGAVQPRKTAAPSKKVTPPQPKEPAKIVEKTPPPKPQPKPEPIVESTPPPPPPPPPPTKTAPPKAAEPEVQDLLTSNVNETIALKKKEEERKRQEAERLEKERLEKEKRQAERIEKELKEREEAEQLAKEQKEYAKAEAERKEREKIEREKLVKERKEKERIEKERIEQERLEAERAEAERLEKERIAAEKAEAERIEQERIAAEKAEAERIAKAKAEAERKEQERKEGEMANIDNFFKGGNNSNSGNDSNSQGNKSGQGDQGVPSGSLDATNMNGDKSTGKGERGFSYDLKGRNIVVKPTIQDDTQKRGTVVVRIKVDKNGNVVSATHQIKGSTTNDSYLVEKAISSAKKAKFNADPMAAVEATGTITYVFKVQ